MFIVKNVYVKVSPVWHRAYFFIIGIDACWCWRSEKKRLKGLRIARRSGRAFGKIAVWLIDSVCTTVAAQGLANPSAVRFQETYPQWLSPHPRRQDLHGNRSRGEIRAGNYIALEKKKGIEGKKPRINSRSINAKQGQSNGLHPHLSKSGRAKVIQTTSQLGVLVTETDEITVLTKKGRKMREHEDSEDLNRLWSSQT